MIFQERALAHFGGYRGAKILAPLRCGESSCTVEWFRYFGLLVVSGDALYTVLNFRFFNNLVCYTCWVLDTVDFLSFCLSTIYRHLRGFGGIPGFLLYAVLRGLGFVVDKLYLYCVITR